MHRHLFALLAFSLAACASQAPTDETPASSVEVPFGSEFELQVGQERQAGKYGPLMVRFDSVSQDSRCPQGVQCVWAGNAAVKLSVLALGSIGVASMPDLKGMPRTPVTLNTSVDPKSVDLPSNLRLTLIELKPANRQGGIPASEYRAILIAEQLK
jgi:hypothetical protein